MIASASLTLEPQLASHAQAMFGVLADSAIYEFENAPPTSVEWLRERYVKLESRRSPNGAEQWLNWVIRLPTGELIGYVQATVEAHERATIAYEIASAHWGRGFGREAVGAMMTELAQVHGVRHFFAVLKRQNFRSVALLKRLGFSPASHGVELQDDLAADEIAMRHELPAP
ncbi:MAG: GNAT family N-acetyltransferase [Casimicrobiaceae bacterium]